MDNVIVAFENEANSAKIRDILEGGGAASCLMCHSAAQVKRTVRKQRPGVIVCGFKLPDEACQDLYQDLPEGWAMLMVAPQARLELCEEGGIFQLPAPVHRADLLASVRMLLQIGQRWGGRKGGPERSGEEQALIGQAKALLMDRHGMTEEQAHRFLQKQSMDHGARLADTARLVLSDD